MVGGEVICGYYGAPADGVYPDGGDGTREMSARHDTHHSSPWPPVTKSRYDGDEKILRFMDQTRNVHYDFGRMQPQN